MKPREEAGRQRQSALPPVVISCTSLSNVPWEKTAPKSQGRDEISAAEDFSGQRTELCTIRLSRGKGRRERKDSAEEAEEAGEAMRQAVKENTTFKKA